MDDCCAHEHGGTAAASKEKAEGCCKACPDAGCEGCDCSKPENAGGGCKGGACGCR